MSESKARNNLNRFFLNGTVTKDGELKNLGNDFYVLEFTVANNYTQKKGETYEEAANFFSCKMVGKRAESTSKIVKKGTGVSIVGQMRQERWEKDGQQLSRFVLLCDDVEVTRWAKQESADSDLPWN